MHGIHPSQMAHAVIRHEAGQLIGDGTSPDYTATGTGTSDDGGLLGDWGMPDVSEWTIPGVATPDPADVPPQDTPSPGALPPASTTPGEIPPESPPGWIGPWPPDASTIGQTAMTGAAAGAAAAAQAAAGGEGGGAGEGGGGNGAITQTAKPEEKFWTPGKIAVAAILGAGGVGLIVYFATRPKRRGNPRRRRR